MRPRSQREMHELLHATGFAEAQMLMDTDGIFVAGSVQKRPG
jgi:hypothetical protein